VGETIDTAELTNIRDSGLPPSPSGLPPGFGVTSGIRDSGFGIRDSGEEENGDV